MKKDRKLKIANTFALSTSIIWLVCSLGVRLFPNISMALSSAWMHGLDMSTMGEWNVTLSSFVVGGLTGVVAAWLTGWLFGWAWERFS